MEEKKKNTTKSTTKKPATKKATTKKTAAKKSTPVKKVEKKVEEPVVVEEVVKEEPVKEEKIDKKVSVKKDSKKSVIITALMALVLALGLYFTYANLLNPKKVFVQAINKGYANFEKKLDKYMGPVKNDKAIVVGTDFKFSMDADESLLDEETKKSFEEFAKLKFSEKVGIDPKNNEMLMKFRYMYDKEDIFNIGTYVKDEKMYVELKNIFDKYIEIPMENSINFDDSTANVDKDDLKYMLSKTKDAIINNMKSKDFKQKTEKIKKGKKTIKVTKVTYGLSEKSATELSLNFLEDISKDSKYIKILAKLSDKSESEIKSEIKESIKEIKEAIKKGDLDKDVKVRFGVLVKGFTKKHVGYIFETVDEAKFVYYKNGDQIEARLSKKDEDLIRASKKDDKTVITFISQGKELELTINKSKKGKKVIYNYDLSASGMSISGKVVIDKIKENKDGTGESKITFEASMMGLVTIKMEGNVKAEYVKKLDLPDLSNSIKAEDLTEEDQLKMAEKIMNNEALKSLTNMFGSGEEEVINY